MRVLLIDDDCAEAMLLRDQLADTGIEIHWHPYVRYAARDIKEGGLRPDLVLCDFCGTSPFDGSPLEELEEGFEGYEVVIVSSVVPSLNDVRYPLMAKAQVPEMLRARVSGTEASQ